MKIEEIAKIFGHLIWNTELEKNTLQFLLENQDWNSNVAEYDKKYW